MGEIRKPRVGDVPAIKTLIDREAARGSMLARTAMELYENIRDFHTYVDRDGVAGCCALHVDAGELAEVRSLVVREDLRGRRIGAKLVNACVEEARELGVRRVYALTRAPGFFEKLGFKEIDKRELPHKVFRDCVRCPLFPMCDEVAMVRDFEAGSPTQTVTAERGNDE